MAKFINLNNNIGNAFFNLTKIATKYFAENKFGKKNNTTKKPGFLAGLLNKSPEQAPSSTSNMSGALPVQLPANISGALPVQLPANISGALPVQLPANISGALQQPANISGAIPIQLPANISEAIPAQVQAQGQRQNLAKAVIDENKRTHGF
jgi:hypothetical protein